MKLSYLDRSSSHQGSTKFFAARGRWINYPDLRAAYVWKRKSQLRKKIKRNQKQRCTFTNATKRLKQTQPSTRIIKEHNQHVARQLKWWSSNSYASELFFFLASSNFQSIFFDTNYFDSFSVKCQFGPKWLVMKSATRFIAINGCGPSVSCFRGLPFVWIDSILKNLWLNDAFVGWSV